MTHSGSLPVNSRPLSTSKNNIHQLNLGALSAGGEIAVNSTISKAKACIRSSVDALREVLLSGELGVESRTPFHATFSALDQAREMIAQASSAIGDPVDVPPIFRFAPTNKRSLSEGIAPVVEPRNSEENRDFALSGGANGTAPLPLCPTLPKAKVMSCEALIQQALSHLDSAADALGGESEVVANDTSPAILKQCNYHLKQAKHYVESAKAGLINRRPGEDHRPPPPPFIGGDDDLWPSTASLPDHLFPPGSWWP